MRVWNIARQNNRYSLTNNYLEDSLYPFYFKLFPFLILSGFFVNLESNTNLITITKILPSKYYGDLIVVYVLYLHFVFQPL